MMQRTYSSVILYLKHRKLLFIAILTWFQILGEIQDGDHCWWRSIKNKITTYLLRQVTRREKGQSSILLLSQFRGSKEIIVNSVKFFLHENCLPFLKLKLITVAVANLVQFKNVFLMLLIREIKSYVYGNPWICTTLPSVPFTSLLLLIKSTKNY